MSTKIKKNEKCLLCLKTGTAIIYDESTPQNKACFACSIKGVKESSEIIKVELEKLKKENKEVYKLRIQEIKIRFAEGKDELEKLKTEYPEFKSELEEIRQENLKAIPEEERDEVGGEKPTNWMPWIIGGSILVGAIVIGLVAYFWWKSTKKES